MVVKGPHFGIEPVGGFFITVEDLRKELVGIERRLPLVSKGNHPLRDVLTLRAKRIRAAISGVCN